MSEDDTRKARQRKRTSQSKRFVAPDNVNVNQAWIGAPPKAKIPQNKNSAGPPGAINTSKPSQAGPPTMQPGVNPPGQMPQQKPPYPGQAGPMPQQGMPQQKPPYPGQAGPMPQQGVPQQKPPYPGQAGPMPQQGMPQQKPPYPGPAGAAPQQGMPQQNPYVPGPAQGQAPPAQGQNAFPASPQQQRPQQAQHNPYVVPPQQGQYPPQQNPHPQPQGQYPPQQNPYTAPPVQQQSPQQNPYLPPGSTPPPQAVPPAPAQSFDLNLTPVPKTTGGLRKTGGVKKQSGIQNTVPTSRKSRSRTTKNWYWPEDDATSDQALNPTPATTSSSPGSAPAAKQQSLSEPLGLLQNGTVSKVSSETNKKSAFARAIDDYEPGRAELKEESKQFSQIADETLEKTIGSDVDARAALDRLARNLASKAVTRELIELSPRVSGLVKTNPGLLRDLVELCRAAERGRLTTECVTKVFEQLNRLYDAPVLTARRDLAVEHFLRALGEALSGKLEFVVSQLHLCVYMLLSSFPDRAAEILLSIMTSTKVNTEELGIRAFKFDRERARDSIKVSREALEPDAAMRRSENIFTHNYFTFIVTTIAINAAMQESNSASRYICKKELAQIYEVDEQEVKPGVFKVVPSAVRDFVGLSYDQLAWINRHFAGQKHRGRTLPDRLKLL